MNPALLPPPLAVRLHAALRRELAQAQARLQGAELPAEAVHEVRKRAKRLRAGLRLLRPALGARARLLDTLLRDTGRALAPWRDAAVAQETLAGLQRAGLGLRPRSAADRALEMLHPGPVQGEALEAARRLLAATQVYFDAGLPAADPGTLHAALARSRAAYARQLRKARRAAADAERLHEWRKRTKRLLLQARLLHAALPGDAGLDPAQRRSLGALADTLGAHHDLHALLERLERAPATRSLDDARRRIRALAEPQLAALARSARRRGERLAL